MGAGSEFRVSSTSLENQCYILCEDARKKTIDIPEDMLEYVDEYRTSLIENAAGGRDD